MKSLLDIFSTRELSFLIWVGLVATILLFAKGVGKSFLNLISTFLDRQILIPFLLQISFICAVIFLFYKIDLWDKSLLKDTIFWYFGVALVLFFTINKAKDFTFFKTVIKESIKWTIIIEFLVNLYTFSFLTELILLPFLLLIVLMQTVSEADKKNEQVTKLLKNILSLFGLVVLVYVTYKTFSMPNKLFDSQNLFSFLLPIFLTLFLVPFIYPLALFANYQTLFVRLNFISKDAVVRKRLKKQILLTANFNINKLTTISKKLNNFDLTQSDNIKVYIRGLLL